MSSCSSRALTILSTVFGACGLLLVGVAVSTDYWLIMVEGIILQQNQSMEVKMALHSGLWRVCFVAGRKTRWHVWIFTVRRRTDTHTETMLLRVRAYVHIITATNTRKENKERARRRKERLMPVTKHVRYLWAGLQRPHMIFFFFLFLHASLTLILKANLNIFSFFLCVFPLRIRKREMCCIRVLHRTRYWDHHWKHCKYPQWVKHITAHYLLCKSLQVWVTEEAPCWLNVGTEIWTPVCNYFD